MSTIESLSDTPRYSIKAVCAQTGIMAVTLRAWERRYNILTPHRTNSNYRLYSERDVALLRWLKSRVDVGVAISSAASELMDLRAHNLWPEAVPSFQAQAQSPAPNPPGQYAERLYNAVIHQDEASAGSVLAEAHSVFDLATVCADIITPCLIMIGDAWHRGELMISTEHIATGYLRGRLMALFQSFPARRGAPYIIMACAPSEQHEIGSLMLATLLRRDGYRVEYLGTGVPGEDLVDFVRAERPAILCLSASSEESAQEVVRIFNSIAAARPTVQLGYGGRVYTLQPNWVDSTPGVMLGASVRDARETIRNLVGA
jgi:DNA-binding transcriptional MerR regulator/methylmalonyl-CoA mutase cobalamin-binding subunit